MAHLMVWPNPSDEQDNLKIRCFPLWLFFIVIYLFILYLTHCLYKGFCLPMKGVKRLI